ncbi:MAG: erythromycin esterase family protein [Chryseosolibacter sp.]
MIKNKKTVTVSAYVKGHGLSEKAYAMLYANARGGGKFKYNQSSRLTAASQGGWHKLTVTVKVPETANSLLFGGIVEGAGMYWFDKFEVLIDETPVQDIASFLPEVTKSQIKWTNDQLNKIGRTKDVFEVNSNFYHEVADAKILGLGEATHGTHEFSLLKSQIIQHIATASDKNVIVAFESAFGAALRINDYIRGGEGDPEEIVRNISNPWRTIELVEMIRWIREFNRTNDNKVLFLGFDMQWPDSEIANLEKFAESHAKILTATVSEIRKLSHGIDRYRTDRRVGPKLDSIVAKLKIIGNLFSEQTRPLDDQARFARHNIDVLSQFIYRLKATGNPSAFRDSCMAANIIWMADHYPDHQIILWAHNGHIRKRANWMGYVLKDRFAEDYQAVGFTTFSGTFSAFNRPHDPEAIPLEAPHPETYEYWFEKLKYDNWIMNVGKLAQNSVSNWLGTPRQFTFVGYKKPVETQFSSTNVMDEFDHLVFIKNTRHISYVNPFEDK